MNLLLQNKAEKLTNSSLTDMHVINEIAEMSSGSY